MATAKKLDEKQLFKPKEEIFICPCGCEVYINYTKRFTELMVDEPEVIEDEVIEDEENSLRTDPLYTDNTNYQKSYASGKPAVPGKATTDGLRITNKPVTNHGSGIRVETAMSAQPPKGVRQQKRKQNLQPLGKATVFGPKKKKPSEMTDADHSREGFESYGDNFSEDFVGQGGQAGHLQALEDQQLWNEIQEQSDPYGFQPPNN